MFALLYQLKAKEGKQKKGEAESQQQTSQAGAAGSKVPPPIEEEIQRENVVRWCAGTAGLIDVLLKVSLMLLRQCGNTPG